MFAVTEFSRSTQRVVCMLMSAVIVSFALTTGAIASQSALHTDYSVTVTQCSSAMIRLRSSPSVA